GFAVLELRDRGAGDAMAGAAGPVAADLGAALQRAGAVREAARRARGAPVGRAPQRGCPSTLSVIVGTMACVDVSRLSTRARSIAAVSNTTWMTLSSARSFLS